MAQYLPIFCISVLAIAFAAGQVFVARLLGGIGHLQVPCRRATWARHC